MGNEDSKSKLEENNENNLSCKYISYAMNAVFYNLSVFTSY